MKRIRHMLEAAAAYLVFYVFCAMGMRFASNIGGWLGRHIGPLLPVSRVAERNLARALPELSDEARQQIVRNMWTQLGRVLGEFPHVPRLRGSRFDAQVTFDGRDHMEAMRAAGKGGIVVSGHFANWEIMPRSAAEIGVPLTLVYRPPNNPYIDRLIRHSRGHSHAGMYAKGPESAKQIIKRLKEGGHIGMLVDQKMNDGVAVPFFGRPAMTAPAMADLALKYGCPLLPARVVRGADGHFTVTVEAPLQTEGKTREVLLEEIHQRFEAWIREHPEQWFWVHKRWGKE